jgi:2-octaprenyl-6-methoxyphenol hydroxylase
MTSYDLAVTGGGIAGTTLACLAGGLGLSVAAIDRVPAAARLAPTFDGRTTAISYGTARVLEAAGVWADLLPRACPIEQIRIADGAAPVFLHFDHEQVEGRPFGWIIENHLIRSALAKRLASLPTIADLSPATVTAYTAEARAAHLTLDNGKIISAPLVVGADGKKSSLRTFAGIETTTHSYDQTALVFVVAHELAHDHIAVEHFRAAGPFAVLPMVDDAAGTHRSSVVWTVRSDEAAPYLAMDEAAFNAALQPVFGSYWGAVRLFGQRLSYPLSLIQARRYTAPRLALASDAAHAVHPIAGQGLNLGLRDVALLAELIADTARLGLDIGSRTVLERYERQRQGDSLRLVAATDLLNRLFSNDLPPVRLARDIGLGIVEKFPALKRFFMLTAMGVALDPPRLVKGEQL